MRTPSLPVLAATLLTVYLSGCAGNGISSTASYNPGYGPFDKDGNYVEEWADKPAKEHWWSRKPETKPAATPSRPTPAPAREEFPLVASNSGRDSRSDSSRKSKPESSRSFGGPLASLNRPTLIARPPEPKPASRPAVSRPVAPSRPSPPAVASRPAPTPRPAPVASTPPPRAQPKPQPVVVKPTKPAPIRHTVRKGDTLYGLGRRYGTSVSAIQRANGLKGNTIRLGQSLRIPR